MFNLKKNKGFTLAELLITLMIVGIVAVLVLPAIITNVNNKAFVTQAKNFTTTIQQLAADQMVTHRTNNLANTDFSNPAELMTAANFTMTETCDNNSGDNCWKTSSSGYRSINGDSYTNGVPSMQKSKAGVTAVLKNGVTVKYIIINNANAYGYFVIDTNGTDGPNIVGRDVFGFYINSKGQVLDAQTVTPISAEETESADSDLDAVIKSYCVNKNDSVDFPEAWCYTMLMRDNWKMNY